MSKRKGDGDVYQIIIGDVFAKGQIIGDVFAKGQHTGYCGTLRQPIGLSSKARDLDSTDCDSDIASHMKNMATLLRRS